MARKHRGSTPTIRCMYCLANYSVNDVAHERLCKPDRPFVGHVTVVADSDWPRRPTVAPVDVQETSIDQARAPRYRKSTAELRALLELD